MDIMEQLNKRTYVVQHNPNCASPFLVRLVGRGSATLDYLPDFKTQDILGYGKTLEEGAEKALDSYTNDQKIGFPLFQQGMAMALDLGLHS